MYVRLNMYLAALAMLAMLLLQGCGGGGGNSTGQTASVRLDVNWAARSKAVNGPSSALSAVLTLAKATPSGGDFIYTIDRDQNTLAAHTAFYFSTNRALVGSWPMTVKFYSQAGGAGSIVGVAQANVTVHSDGTGIGTVTTTSSIASVSVSAGQSIHAGQTSNLDFSARDANNNVLALSPGGAFFTLTGGSDKLQLNSTSGSVTGLAVGTAQVTVTIDGKTSPAQTITVTGGVPGSVTVSPSSAMVQTGGTQTFSATVVGLPGTSVTWSVQEGTAGGAITGSGAYTASGTPGTYHVVATSVADPTKSATATVTVTTAPTVSVTVLPSPITIASNAAQTFTATVSGSSNTAVTWSVQEGAVGGSVTSGGVYTASTIAGTYHVVATSVADTSKSGIATITVTTGSAISVAVTPSPVTVNPGAVETFVATVSGSSNTAVTWSVQEGSAGGSVTSGGIYTAPSMNGTYHVVATSVVDTSKKGTATINVLTSNGGGGGSNQIYVADRINHRIIRMDDMTGANWVSFGTKGAGVNQFTVASSVAVDRLNRIYITDTTNHRIVRIDDMTGAGWTTLGIRGTGVNQFEDPVGLCVDDQLRIYVADTALNRIVRFDDMNGTNWVSLGSQGSGINQFDAPQGIFVDSLYRIYITDDLNSRIIRMDDMNGTNWITYGGTDGDGVGEFAGPQQIFVDSQFHIFISDEDNGRIVRINDMTGAGWTSFGSTGSGVGQFNFPSGLFVDSTGQMTIADRRNNRMVRVSNFAGDGWTAVGTLGGAGIKRFNGPFGMTIH